VTVCPDCSKADVTVYITTTKLTEHHASALHARSLASSGVPGFTVGTHLPPTQSPGHIALPATCPKWLTAGALSMMAHFCDPTKPNDAEVDRGVGYYLDRDEHPCMETIRTNIRKEIATNPALKCFQVQYHELLTAPQAAEFATSVNRRRAVFFPHVKWEAVFQRIMLRLRWTAKDLIMEWSRSEVEGTGVRAYTDSCDTDAWRIAQGKYRCNPKTLAGKFRRVLFIHLYCDETVENTIGSKALFPIYATIGNLPIESRRGQDAFVMVGLVPVLPDTVASEYTEHVLDECLRVLFTDLDAIHERGGIPLSLGPGLDTIYLVPVIGVISGDYPQLQDIAGCFKCPNSNYSCRMELTHKDDAIRPVEFGAKRSRALWESMTNSDKLVHGFREREVPALNACFALGRGEVFRSTPGDLLHSFELSLLKDIMVQSMELLRRQVPSGQGMVDAFAKAMKRLKANVRKFPQYDSGSKGTSSCRLPTEKLAGFTGSQVVELFQKFPFCMQGLLEVDDEDHGLYDRLQKMYVAVEQLARALFSCKSWTSASIDSLRHLCNDALAKVVAAFGDSFHPHCPTIHSILHYADHISVHGPPTLFDTAWFESLHVFLKRQAERAAQGELREYSVMERDGEERAMQLYIHMARLAANPDTRSSLPTGWQTTAFDGAFPPEGAAREQLDPTDVRTFKGFEDCLGYVFNYGSRKWKLLHTCSSQSRTWTADALSLSMSHFEHLQREICCWIDYYNRQLDGSTSMLTRTASTSPEGIALASTLGPHITSHWFTNARICRATDDVELFRVYARYGGFIDVSFVSYFDDRVNKAVVGMVEFLVEAKLTAGVTRQFAVVRQMAEVANTRFRYAATVKFASFNTDAFICVPVSAIVRRELVVPDFDGLRGVAALDDADDDEYFEPLTEAMHPAVEAMDFTLPERPNITRDAPKRNRYPLPIPEKAKSISESQLPAPQDYATMFWAKRGLIV
jgi:hypothetical protein